jgi:hypothetical protein
MMKSPDLGRVEDCLQLFVEIRGQEIGERIQKDLGDDKKLALRSQSRCAVQP